jgi:putative endonuclease
MAARWYERRGYEILARNWRCRDGEIDLVVRGDGCIVFSEVKTRTSARFGAGSEAVSPVKQRRIRRLAASWFAQSGTSDRGSHDGVRFDVVSITSGRIEVIEGAF